MVPPVCQLAQIQWTDRQTDTHTRPLMLVGALLGLTGPDSGNSFYSAPDTDNFYLVQTSKTDHFF